MPSSPDLSKFSYDLLREMGRSFSLPEFTEPVRWLPSWVRDFALPLRFCTACT